MAKKKSPKTKNKFPLRRHKIGLIVSLCICVFILFSYFPIYLLTAHHPIPETKKNLQKSIPNDVKNAHPLASSSASYRIPILMYHYVEYVKDKKDTIRQSLDTEPYIFDAQIKSLVDAKFTFLSMAEVGQILAGKKKLPLRPVAITFDDGYRDFYTDAYPILKKYRVKATAYLVPGFFDQPNYLQTQQVRVLAKNDLIELGAHTVHHVWLKDMSSFLAEREIKQSKYVLEDIIHKPVVSFAYPYGAFDNSAIELVKKTGFLTAVSTIPGIEASQSNSYFLFRIRPGMMTGPTLVDYVTNPPYHW